MKHHPKIMLVTGSAGFIGANFVRQELENNPALHIVSLDKLTYAGSIQHLSHLDDSRHTFVKGDICDGGLVLKLLRDYDVDTIVHFAAESHVDRSIGNPRAFVETNVLGTLTLLQCVKETWGSLCKGRRFHHISTDEVYGSLKTGEEAFTEQHAYRPNSPYSASKAGSDHLVRAFAHTYGLPVTISNCSNNYGPYQHREKLIPTIIHACLNQTTIPIYGDGSNIRDWIFVLDHCEAINKIIREGKVSETYNVGGECEVSNLELATLIAQLMDVYYPKNAPHKKLIQFIADRPGHDWRYAIDNTKINRELHWYPKTKLVDGLKQAIDFYLKQKLCEN